MTVGRTCWCGRAAITGSSTCALHQVARRLDISEAQRRQTNRRRNQRADHREYDSAEFKRNRPLVLERARGRCESCGRRIGLRARDWVCDHIVPIVDGGGSEMSNLGALCVPCSNAKTRLDRARRRQ